MNEALLIALQLLLAHVLTDFVFQSKALVKHKRKNMEASWFLYVHALTAGLLSYLFLQNWTAFLVPIVIALSHFVIDLWKLRTHNDGIRVFLLDQLFHILVLIIAWMYLSRAYIDIPETLVALFNSTEFLAIIIAYLIVIFPVGFLIGKATWKWQRAIEESESNSLKNAGRFIGIFERVLILTLILTDNFGAIGFLIGAKSILRFSDSKTGSARKQTEYVLIGTLMSFALSIAVGSLVRVLVF